MRETEKEFMSQVMKRVIELLDSTQKGDYPLALEIGLGRSSIQSWRNNKSNASAYALAQIADYFNVSLDYLVGRETQTNTVQVQQNTTNNGTTDPLLNRIAQLDKLQQAKVAAYIDGLQGAETSIEKAFRHGQELEKQKQSKEEIMQQQKKFN